MYDYKLLEALAMVSWEKGFDRAADKLCLTQSAVSQRIKLLEEQTGQILITRASPPEPTQMGKKLIKHYRQVRQLEEELHNPEKWTSIAIGLNADSLATWFLTALEPILQREIRVELRVDDQDRTSELLKNGEVAGCISSREKALQGCGIHHLGKMDYTMVCTPSFYERWFSQGLTLQVIERAPAVYFNRKDSLHLQYLSFLFEDKPGEIPTHYVPSIEKFLDLILAGHAYGVAPLIQCGNLIKEKKLVEIGPEHLEVNLFWHHWNLNSELMNDLTKAVLEGSRLFLR